MHSMSLKDLEKYAPKKYQRVKALGANLKRLDNLAKRYPQAKTIQELLAFEDARRNTYRTKTANNPPPAYRPTTIDQKREALKLKPPPWVLDKSGEQIIDTRFARPVKRTTYNGVAYSRKAIIWWLRSGYYPSKQDLELL